MTLPSRASDAGPLNRTPHIDDVKCAACNRHVSKWSAFRCQGAAGGVEANGAVIPADMCCSMMCEDCLKKCAHCGLPVCEEHRGKIDGDLLCESCRVDLASAAALELAAAMEEGRVWISR